MMSTSRISNLERLEINQSKSAENQEPKEEQQSNQEEHQSKQKEQQSKQKEQQSKQKEQQSKHEEQEEQQEEQQSKQEQAESICPSPEKVLKIVFVSLLFLIALGCGYVSRITLHILIWHVQPPVHSDVTINRLGGLLKSNCSTCIPSANMTSKCPSQIDTGAVDMTWIWALFLVITAPYLLTFLSTTFRIIFKSNQPLNIFLLLKALVIETAHSIGLSMLAFLVLPSFDPASASVLYMAVAVLLPALYIIDQIILIRKRKKVEPKTTSDKETGDNIEGKNTQKQTICNKMGIMYLFSSLAGILLQITGIICISIVIHWQTERFNAVFVLGVILTSIKYWMNFVNFGEKNSTGLRQIKQALQLTPTKVACIASLWKIIVTFFAVMTIFISRVPNSTQGFYALLKNEASTLSTLFGDQNFGDNNLCSKHAPFLVAAVNIACSYLCYKASKVVCVINCQRLGFSLPLIILPLATTGTLIGLIIFVLPFYCGLFIELSLLLNRRRKDSEYDIIAEDIPEDTNAGSSRKTKRLLVCAATMWHETETEMMQLLQSIFRLDTKQFLNKWMAKKASDTEKENIETFDMEAHIFFDDAFDPIKKGETYPDANKYVKTFISVMNEAGSKVHEEQIELQDELKYWTPYGGRIEWTLPGSNKLVVHLKDKDKIRHKKRWSQIMYMHYILNYRLRKHYINEQGFQDFQEAAKNTFILALDGDVEFEPEAVMSLMRRMIKSREVGAACGRIHPVGSGPMVWYQMFEYAISHWLQKATEHVIGCVLCSPGCFSLFRGSAILSPGVLNEYSTVAKEAKHYVQYDQGEDRWLCTLLLKQGKKIEYCAESDAYTFAPEGFYEFYNQRRRWTPSTMANILDLILDWKKVTKNNNISLPYIIYHVFLFVSTLLTPGTVFMIILGAIIVGFDSIPPWLSLILNLIPVAIFMLMTLYASSQRQLQYAAILSCIYVIVMVIVLIGVIRDAAADGMCSMSTIIIIFVAGVFVIAAIIHPKEFLCLIPGLLYFLAIPSMSMLMFLYSIGNLHIVSWGTRETKTVQTDSEKGKPKFKTEQEDTGDFFSLGRFFSCICSCSSKDYTKEDLLYKNLLNQAKVVVKPQTEENKEALNESENTNVGQNGIQESDIELRGGEQRKKTKKVKEKKTKRKQKDRYDNIYKSNEETKEGDSNGNQNKDTNIVNEKGSEESVTVVIDEGQSDTQKNGMQIRTGSPVNPKQVDIYEDKQVDMYEDKQPKEEKKKEKTFDEKTPELPEENEFWKDTIAQYLKPLEKDEQKEKQIAEDLIDLRNRVSLFVFLLNAILVTVMFGLTQVDTFSGTLTIFADCNGNPDSLKIVPIALLFSIVFGILLLLQFFGMLYHRFSTLIHICASTYIKDKKDYIKMKICEKVLLEAIPPPVVGEDPLKSTLIADKNKKRFEMNKTIKPEERTCLRDVVVRNLKAKGSLHVKREKKVKEFLDRWRNEALQTPIGEKNQPKLANIVDQAVAMNKAGPSSSNTNA